MSTKIAYKIPWEQKAWIAKAQRAAKQDPRIQIKGDLKGLHVEAESSVLASSGLKLPLKGSEGAARPARTLKAHVSDSQYVKHLSGMIVADLRTTADPVLAEKLAQDCILAGCQVANVCDKDGKLHTAAVTTPEVVPHPGFLPTMTEIPSKADLKLQGQKDGENGQPVRYHYGEIPNKDLKVYNKAWGEGFEKRLKT